MKNPELYQKTVDILVQAYFNDTLLHGNCCACAVGNMVAANTGKGYEFHPTTITWKGYEIAKWDNVFCTDKFGHQEINEGCYGGIAKKEIDSTGYSWNDLSKIEYAFETARKGKDDDEWMFNGLMAVIEVLDIIHENNDTELTTATKQRFLKCI